MKSRKWIYIIIIAISIVAIISAIFIQSNFKKSKNKIEKNNQKTQEELKNEFSQLFNNDINLNNYDTSNIKKFDDSKEILYTAYQSDAFKTDKYELDVNIPVININEKVTASFNDNTQKIFADKTTQILNNSKVYTIYRVEYTGYINEDILSVIIKSTLKEGDKPQRIIVQTYNYNIVTGKEVDIYDAISQKGISKEILKEKINEEIKKAITDENKIQMTGLETYTRDINSEIYLIENIQTFFIGENGTLYVIFAYGNNNFTSEMDIIEIN